MPTFTVEEVMHAIELVHLRNADPVKVLTNLNRRLQDALDEYWEEMEYDN